LERHLPPRSNASFDPVATGSVTAFADPERAMGSWQRTTRPEGSTVALAGHVQHQSRRHREASHRPTAITRRIARVFADRVIAAISRRPQVRIALVTRPLTETSLRHLLASARLRRDISSGMAHPEQIKIAALLAVPEKVTAAGFTRTPLTGLWKDRFDGADVAIVPTRSFDDRPDGGQSASAGSAEDSHG
jgi:hypothetical protein